MTTSRVLIGSRQYSAHVAAPCGRQSGHATRRTNKHTQTRAVRAEKHAVRNNEESPRRGGPRLGLRDRGPGPFLTWNGASLPHERDRRRATCRKGWGWGARQAGLGQLGGGQVPHRSERKEGDRGSAQGAAAGRFSSVGVRFVPGGHCGLERGRAQESQSCRPLGRVLAPPSPWESQRLGGRAPSAWR